MFYETYEKTIFTFQIDKMNQKEKKFWKQILHLKLTNYMKLAAKKLLQKHTWNHSKKKKMEKKRIRRPLERGIGGPYLSYIS